MKLSGKIAFASGKTGDYDIWTLDAASGTLEQITYGDCWNDKPFWSPDGKWIVFVSNRSGFSEIYKIPGGGGEPVQLTKLDRWADSPAFSPDGSAIALISNEAGNNDIWVMDVDGGNRRQVTTHEGSDDHVAWTPDGKGLLWSSDRTNGDADIWHWDFESGTKKQLNSDFGADITPTASPDGKLIAFASNRQLKSNDRDIMQDRDKDVWLLGIDGSHPVRVTSNQGADYCPCWSPDGQHLLYAAGDDRTSSHLRVVDLAELVAAYAMDNSTLIEEAAEAIRTEALPLDRDPLKQEISAHRHTTFLTALMPESWLKGCYPAGYFGLERYPHWVGAKGAVVTPIQTPIPTNVAAENPTT